MTASASATKAFAQIELVIADYLDGIHFGDLAKLRRAMHPDCRMIALSGDEYAITGMEEYFTAVANRKSPAEIGEPRMDSVEAIDVSRAPVAVVTLRCLVLGKACADTLTLIEHDSEWKIISKVFSYELVAG